jgi:secreted trypsin-like serine protease
MEKERGKDKEKESLLALQGDSGGPLYLKYTAPGGKFSLEFNSLDKPWFLLGIVSFGSKWCGVGHPGVYTRSGLHGALGSTALGHKLP